MAKQITGTVVSTGGEKTITVLVTRAKNHPLLNKRYNVSKKFHVHDEKNEAGKGDKVVIEECPPVSKNKTWKLASVVEKSVEDLEVEA